MEGLQKFKSIPCSIFHDSIMYTVEGCKDQEVTDLLVCMENCNKIQIIFHLISNNSARFCIVIGFERNDITE